MKYEIRVYRPEAALYLAWEYGIRRAREILATAPADPVYSPGFVRLTFGPFLTDHRGRRTRAAAENYAARIREAVAFQQGRLGRPLRNGDVYVVAR